MLAPRLQSEREFHDEQALERAGTFAREPDRLEFRDAEYLDHETWIRPAFEQLWPLNGKYALDYGCGHGMASVVLARAGATVSGFDLSPEYVAEARRRAEANGVRVDFRSADAEELPYADESFDAVWGNAILHHLDLDRAGAELKRVLKPGGVAVFCEPWGGNPFLNFARRCLPYPGKKRTVDERPLNAKDLEKLQHHFPTLQWSGYQFFGMIGRVWKEPWLRSLLGRLDSTLLRLVPPLKHWCRYGVVVVMNGI